MQRAGNKCRTAGTGVKPGKKTLTHLEACGALAPTPHHYLISRTFRHSREGGSPSICKPPSGPERDHLRRRSYWLPCLRGNEVFWLWMRRSTSAQVCRGGKNTYVRHANVLLVLTSKSPDQECFKKCDLIIFKIIFMNLTAGRMLFLRKFYILFEIINHGLHFYFDVILQL